MNSHSCGTNVKHVESVFSPKCNLLIRFEITPLGEVVSRGKMSMSGTSPRKLVTKIEALELAPMRQQLAQLCGE